MFFFCGALGDKWPARGQGSESGASRHRLAVQPSPRRARCSCECQTGGQSLPPCNCDGFSPAGGWGGACAWHCPSYATHLRAASSSKTSVQISASGFPAIRAALSAATSCAGQPTARPPRLTGCVKTPCAMRKIKRAAGKAGCRFHSGKPQDGLSHCRFSLSDSGPLRKHPVCARWAIKARCALCPAGHLRAFFGCCGQQAVAANDGKFSLASAKHCALQGDSARQVGRKNSSQLFYRVMCLRIVSALRPWAMSNFATLCEYHLSDIPGRRFFSARYSFRQLSCRA